jgi:type II secretory pathway pseudopilin PulG
MKKAFTLIEILIYMGIMTIFIVILGQVLSSVLDAQTDAQDISAVEIDSRYLLTRLTYDIRRSSAVTAPAHGQTDTSFTLTIGGTSHTYSVNQGRLQLTANSVDSILSSWDTQVSNFSVTRIGNPTGRPTLQVSFTVTSDQETQNYLTTVSLR